MKYFVTGATGFIGGRLAEVLIERGHEVIALVRTPAKAQHLVAKGIQIVQGDITDKESMREPMTGVDGVYHIAAWYKVGEKSDMAYQINVEGTRNVCELMLELNIPKGVYTSSLAVFGNTDGKIPDESYRFDPTKHDFLSTYDETKWRAHYEVALPMMQAGLPLIIAQPGAVYGTGDTSTLGDMFEQFLKRSLPMIPSRTAFMWAHVDDVVEGHILAMEKGNAGETYIIGGPHATLVDAMKLAEDITGIKAPSMYAPPIMLKMTAAVMSLVNAIVPITGQYHPEFLRVGAGNTYLGDNSKAKRELGYNPRPLREGLEQTLIPMMKELGIQPKS